MATIKLNLVDSIDKVKNKGDARIVSIMKRKPSGNGKTFIHTGEVDYYQLIICCPQCGEVSGSSGKHKYDMATQTYHPSIVHNVDLGGCGYHGWLKDGIFTDV